MQSAKLIGESNILEIMESYNNINEFEDFILSHKDMSATKRIIEKIIQTGDEASDPDSKKRFLLDYSSFLKLLIDFYKGGIRKKEDGNLEADNNWYTKDNLTHSFRDTNLLQKYCEDGEQDELCCEPILLFDDEDSIKQVSEIKEFPIIIANQIDTQIMSEQNIPGPIDGTYNLTPMLPVLNGIFQTVKQLGTVDLAKAVVSLRTKILQLNGKPLTMKDKLLGRLSPPEGFILLRLAERLTNLRTQGSKVLSAVQQAEDEDNQITPEEFEEIKNYLVGVLKQPIKKVTPAVMGPLMSREVARLENQVYGLSPEALAEDFIQAIDANANKLPDDPDKYYKATQQMFSALNAASSTANAVTRASMSQVGNNQHVQGQTTQATPAGAGAYPPGARSVGQQTFLNLQNPRSKEAARSAITKISGLIDHGAKPEDVALALADLQKRFVPRQ